MQNIQNQNHPYLMVARQTVIPISCCFGQNGDSLITKTFNKTISKFKGCNVIMDTHDCHWSPRNVLNGRLRVLRF